jgi:hypothetical protein
MTLTRVCLLTPIEKGIFQLAAPSSAGVAHAPKTRAANSGWDGFPLLASEMVPGEKRRLGFIFLSGAEAVFAQIN